MSDVQATPRPWRIEDYPDDQRIDLMGTPASYGVKGQWTLAELDYGGACVLEAEYRANARLIVRAVNAHDPMREALVGLYSMCPEGHLNDDRGLWARARDALALAHEGRVG